MNNRKLDNLRSRLRDEGDGLRILPSRQLRDFHGSEGAGTDL